MRRAAVALAAVAACALVPATAGASGGPTKTVYLHDDYFSVTKMTVKPNTTIKWVWSPGLTDTHDVMLSKHPKGVKPFMSEYAASDYTFKRMLTKPGTYTFTCDLHSTMKMTIVVK